MIAFGEFATKVLSAGFVARECQSDHWQIINGKRVVNFWPTKSKYHVAGNGKSKRGSLDEAIAAARTVDRYEPAGEREAAPEPKILRDEFALAALPALIQLFWQDDDHALSAAEIMADAYMFADRAMKQRKATL